MAHVFSYGGKTCKKYYTQGCDSCETCVFDEENFNFKKSMEIIKPKTCNVCQFSQNTMVSRNSLRHYNNWDCMCNGVKRLLDISVPSDKNITIPNWCPMGYNRNENGEEFKKSYTPLTYSEKRSVFDNIEPLMKWEDIKEKEIYHIPPLPTETRKDILIMSKTDFSCTYKVLSATPNAYSTVYTMYKSSLAYKFLTKHKVKEIEVVNIINNK